MLIYDGYRVLTVKSILLFYVFNYESILKIQQTIFVLIFPFLLLN